MSDNLIGKEVELNGELYKVVGTVKRSYVLEKDGKKYKATANKIKAIQKNNGENKERKGTQYPYLQRRVKMNALFFQDSKIPTNEAECFQWFKRLCFELEPENLSADGERSQTEIRHRTTEIKKTWRELENILGRKVSQKEVGDLG